MANFWKLVNEVIDRADLLLIVLDARLVDETRNIELEKKITVKGKPFILVLNKCDLTSKEYLEKKKKTLKNAVFISSLQHLGTTMLRDKIFATAKKKKNEKITVGVVGYPNTGKSSVINALKGQKSAPASSQSGYTKAIQLVRADNRIYLIDTPGVIPFEEKDQIKHALMGAIDATKVKDPDVAAMRLIEILEGKAEAHYGLEKQSDSEVALEKIAKKLNKLKKHNELDLELVGRLILQDWQKGKIKL
ncbi:50S ribosome-binding GTPase [Candidatus Woesearchaeota archaeon]|nr:50S ribosome-binding GTPase [Candidatus Woesearchaeota archaeon]